jgi:hypothetical protein
MAGMSVMLEGGSEAMWKHRGNGRASTSEGASQQADNPWVEEDAAPSPKAFACRASLVSALRRCLFHAQLSSKATDALAVMALLISLIGSQWYTMEVLLQPPGAFATNIAAFAIHTVHALFCLSWISVAYHGPGRVDPQEQSVAAPTEFVSALRVGQFCEDPPFSDESRWCGPCSSWILHSEFQHTGISGMPDAGVTGLMYSHHCKFAATCIGFRNLRCFVVWLVYGQALMMMLVLLTVRSLCISPHFRETALQVASFLPLLVYYAYLSHTSLSSTSKRLLAGWRSWVLLRKYETLVQEAQKAQFHLSAALDDCLGPDQQADPTVSNDTITLALDRLNKAIAGVHFQRGLLGLFSPQSFVDALVPVFGEPFSLLWWVPMRSGGSGDPLAPTFYNEKACKAWVELGEALEYSIRLTRLRKEAAAQWAHRISQLLSASKSGAKR